MTNNFFAVQNRMLGVPTIIYFDFVNHTDFEAGKAFGNTEADFPIWIHYSDSDMYQGMASLAPIKTFTKGRSFLKVVGNIEMNFEDFSGIESVRFGDERFGSCNFTRSSLQKISFIDPPNFTEGVPFFSYSELSAIPQGLCNKIINTDIQMRFMGTSITGIPSDLFANTNFEDFTMTFAYCDNLKTIHPNLFFPQMAHNTHEPLNFTYTFYGCTNLTGNAPKLWEMFPDAIGTMCFYGCTKLSNYNQIPTEWKSC